ncbi:MAG: HAD-IIIC family phosphatase [Solirubrobacteraceae bacterium]
MTADKDRPVWRAGDGLPSHRDVLTLRAGLADPPPGAVSVVLAGNCNTDFLIDPLRIELDAAGVPAGVVSTAYGAGVQDALSDARDGDFWVFWLSSMGATDGGTDRRPLDVAGVVAAAEHLIARGRRVIVIPPEPVLAEEDPFSPFGVWRREATEALTRELPADVVVLRADGLLQRLGIDRWVAPRYWEHAKAACHPDAAVALAVEIGVVVARLLRPVVKAVAIDLDDTLWGGLVGEVGAAGLELDPQGAGRSYLEMQRYLADLRDRGILLGVVSKNDDDEARRPFAERSEMLLGLEDFAYFSASWDAKHAAIRAFAAAVNVGLDAVCLLDDSPGEREEARAFIPELIVPELPASPGARVAHLVRTKLFVTPVVTEEDRLRGQSVQHVQPAAGGMDHATYLAGLEMVLEATPLGPDTMARAVSLLNKTNQFNLNGRRPTPSEVEAAATDDGAYAYVHRLRDRVADHGNIAVLIAHRSGGTAVIDSWVMSCRVFNRGVEWAVAEHFAAWVARTGVETVRGEYVRTDRNHLVADLLSDIGLRAAAAAEDRRAYEGESIHVPDHHLTIVEP